jgi:hypothetical protein
MLFFLTSSNVSWRGFWLGWVEVGKQRISGHGSAGEIALNQVTALG